MNKAYSRINWQNAPSEATALNETNLNKMDSAIDTIDDRVVAHDTRLDNDEYAIGQAGDNITALQGDVSTLEGTVSTQGSAITALQSGKVDKQNGFGLSTLMNIEAQSSTNKGTTIGAFLLDKYTGNPVQITLKNGIEVDSALSDSSENPVQNKAIKMVLDEKVDKVSGKGLFTFSDMVFHEDTSYTGDVVAHIVFTTQDPNDPQIQFDIYNGMVAITNAEIDALA